MSKRTRERNFWLRYGISNPKRVPDNCDQFGSRFEDLTDEDLDHFTRRVKRVDSVILGENDVTNEGVAHLTRLEYLRKLDLKDLNIDDACLTDLLKLQSLEWLNIRSTNISPEGILTIQEGLKNLKTFIYSHETEEGC